MLRLTPRARAHGAWLAAACIVIAVRAAGMATLDDPFHQGEYFAAAQAVLDPRRAGYLPLTIHGALDFLPALLARAIWGPDRYFLPTRALYQISNILASAAFVGIAWEIVRTQRSRTWLLMAAVMAGSVLPGYRDLLLLVSLYCFTLGTRRSLEPPLARLVQAALGIALAAGVFWSYDRGIAAVASLLPATMLMATRERFRWTAPVAFVVTVAALGAASPAFSASGYWQNVRVLFDTAAQWETGDPSFRFWVSLFVVTANVTAFAAYFQIRLAEGQGPSGLGEAAGLALVAAFMARIALNRGDLDHVAMGLWMPMLFALGAAGRTARGRIALEIGAAGALVGGAILLWSWHTIAIALSCAAIGLAVFEHRSRRVALFAFRGMVVAAFAMLVHVTLDVYQAGLYGWWRTLADAPPNEAVVFPGVRWAAAQLRDDDVPCVLDLANNGVIAGLVGRPACSRFALPVYATAKYESELIAALIAKHPETIVYSTVYWSYAIDGLDMRRRFPALDAFIRSRYRHERCRAGYCVRSMD